MPAAIRVIKTLNFEESRARGGEVLRFLFHVPTKTFIIGGARETHGHLYDQLQHTVRPSEGEIVVGGRVTEGKGNLDFTSERPKDAPVVAKFIPLVRQALRKIRLTKGGGVVYHFVEREWAEAHSRPNG